MNSSRSRACCLFTLALCLLAVLQLPAETFLLPTANRALFEKGGDENFFVGTVGKSWTSGCFGCVRTEGRQMHEGLDIRCLQRDKHGEPVDPVIAAAAGTVAYINSKSSLSNYGNYILLRHKIDGLEIYSLYAHLGKIRDGLKTGDVIRAGEVIATMGRTTNTKEGISKERAHVHFELDFLVNDRFANWYGKNFDLVSAVRNQTELCRVFLRDTNFPWIKRYPQLIRPNPRAGKEGVAGYEIALNFNGLPFEVTPRAASEIKSKSKLQLLSVNAAEEQKNPCRKLVTKRSGSWELTNRGIQLIELLVY